MFSRPRWMGRSSRRSRPPRSQGALAVSGVLSAEELERAFQRERARVDRNGQSFSVVVFEPGPSAGADLAEVARYLLDRVRDYDDVGALDAERLAVLLPESDASQAWTFADQARAQLADGGMELHCDVYAYPHEASGSDAAGPTLPHQIDKDRPREWWTEPGTRAEAAGPRDESRTSVPGTPFLMAVGSVERPVTLRPVGGADAPVDGSREDLATVEAREERAMLALPREARDLTELFEEPLPRYRRVVDVVAASAALAVLSPVLVAAALAVRVTSPGPVIYSQWRAGRGGRPFRFYKIRSMYLDADDRKTGLRLVNEKDGPIFKMRDDPRITPVGKVLRKLSIDEMPQLFNVLRGDMTLVGPRPPVMDEVEGYERWQRQRLEVTGGITCIWQVSGRSEVSFRDWMRMDVRYRKNRSFWLDVKLIWKTFGAVFSGRGAY